MKTSESNFCNCLYFTTNALARKVEKLAGEAWKPVGLSPSHGYLLMMVIEQPGIQPGTLADHLQLSPSTISRLIEKLEEKKLAVRVTEGKITNVYASPTGKNLLPKLKSCVDSFYKNYTAILGKEESNAIVNSVRKMADKLS
jgi:MarR family transcriptional regulator, organic hydroperoxide resistance regulator